MLRCLLLLLCFLLAACGKANQSPVLQSRTETPEQFTARQLVELDALHAPPGVAETEWEQLKSALRAQIESGISKVALTAPTTNGSAAKLSLNGDTRALSWGLALQGDYDQNGEVNISDLTPLGAHLGESVPADVNDILAVIDGDGNGQLNISDLTPLGANLGRRAQGYNIFRSLTSDDLPPANGDPNGAGAELVGSVPLSATPTSTTHRRQFNFVLADPNLNYFFWVRPNDLADGSGEDGTPSNTIQGSTVNLSPVAVLHASTNPYGDVPFTYTAYTVESYDLDGQIVKFEIDKDGDGSFEDSYTSDPVSVELTYEAPGVFDAALRVTDDDGATATDTFQVEARNPLNALPVADLQASAMEGDVPLTIDFDASASSDVDGTIVKYEWDFEQDGVYDEEGTSPTASHEYTNAGATQAIVRITDSLGSRALGAVFLQLTDPGNAAPVAVLSADPLSGPGPLTVHFDASASSDSDGTIKLYSWDFDGDGSSDASTHIPFASHTYYAQGIFSPEVYVRDNDNENSLKDSLEIEATTGWDVQVVQTGVAAAHQTHLLTLNLEDVLQQPLLGYDMIGDGIYVTLGNTDASEFGAPVKAANDPDSGYWDMKLVNGNPAVAFTRDGNPGVGGVRYARATDPAGAAWGAEVAIDLTGSNIGRSGIALEMIGSNPGIAYINNDAPEVRFTRALTNDGSIWNIPSLVADHGEPPIGDYSLSLLFNGELPLVINGSFGVVNHAYSTLAQSQNGTVWEASQPVAGAEATQTAAMVDGVPAIVFSTVNEIKFLKATDDVASDWLDPVTIYTSDNVGNIAEVCLAMIGDVPGVAFRDYARGAAAYVQAEDSAGLTWGEPEFVDEWHFAGEGLSLASYLDRPIMAWVTNQGGFPIELRFAYKND